MGIEAALKKDDALITAYRAYGWTYIRGVSIVGVLAELAGKNAMKECLGESVLICNSTVSMMRNISQ